MRLFNARYWFALGNMLQGVSLGAVLWPTSHATTADWIGAGFVFILGLFLDYGPGRRSRIPDNY